MSRHYDYIITGGGLAGLSLVYHLLHSSLKDKSILLIDREKKKANDRTWCFWEKEKGSFDEIVHHKWSNLGFHTDDFSIKLEIAPYEYKMIRGLDFYNYVDKLLINQHNVYKSVENVKKIVNTENGVRVSTQTAEYTADYCFNSILFEKIDKSKNLYLDQHFKGWIIQTQKPFFNPQEATLMDFRTPHSGETRFIYTLPTSEKEALIEATLFSPDLLPQQEYNEIIENYIQEFFPNIGAYEVIHEEYGVIPMTDFVFSEGEGNILNIGTAGGQTKASSGYTFWYLQNHIKNTVQQLEKTGNPRLKKTKRDKRSYWKDKIFLNVLQYHRLPPPVLFGLLFQKNTPQSVFKFMSEQTSLWEDIKIASTLPVLPFLKALVSSVIGQR